MRLSIFEIENHDENENLQIQNDQQIEIFNLNLTICWSEQIFKFKIQLCILFSSLLTYQSDNYDFVNLYSVMLT